MKEKRGDTRATVSDEWDAEEGYKRKQGYRELVIWLETFLVKDQSTVDYSYSFLRHGHPYLTSALFCAYKNWNISPF